MAPFSIYIDIKSSSYVRKSEGSTCECFLHLLYGTFFHLHPHHLFIIHAQVRGIDLLVFSPFVLWHLFPSISSSSLHHTYLNRGDRLGSAFTICSMPHFFQMRGLFSLIGVSRWGHLKYADYAQHMPNTIITLQASHYTPSSSTGQ